jgi:multimeric flavodoxin WrbA
MAKKILAIVGTYRKNGAVDSAVDQVLASARQCGAETQKIYLLDKHIEFCTNCRLCTQSPGPSRGKCTHNDDIEEIFTLIEQADSLVFASPVNFYNVTALTRRFMERFVSFAYWPWGTGAPKLRQAKPTKKAVLITASAMPAFMGQIFTGAIRALKGIAKISGAKTVCTIFIGTASMYEKQPLSPKIISKAQNAGMKLAC